MSKMTKTQARKRVNEIIIKLSKVSDYMVLHTALTKADQTLISGLFLDLHKLKKKLE